MALTCTPTPYVNDLHTKQRDWALSVLVPCSYGLGRGEEERGRKRKRRRSGGGGRSTQDTSAVSRLPWPPSQPMMSYLCSVDPFFLAFLILVSLYLFEISLKSPVFLTWLSASWWLKMRFFYLYLDLPSMVPSLRLFFWHIY